MVNNMGLDYTMIKIFNRILIIILLFLQFCIPVSAEKSETKPIVNFKPVELKSWRTETTKTYYLGNYTYRIDLSGIIHYKDNYSNKSENWKDIDLTIKDNQISTAPYVLDIKDNTYKIIDKKTGDWLEITANNDSKLQPLLNGFKLTRTIYSELDIQKANTDFIITSKGSSIGITSNAYDSTGKIIPINKSIKNGILSENIDSKEFSKIVYPVYIDPIISVNITSSSDDAEQQYTSMTLNSAYIYTSVYRRAGFCFNNIDLSSTDNITSANVSIYRIDAGANLVNTDIYAELIGDASTFGSNSNNISARQYSANYTNWYVGSYIAGYNTSPDISNMLKEVIALPTWSSGNSIVIKLDSYSKADANFAFSTYDSGSNWPKLSIEYTSLPAGNEPTVITNYPDSIAETTATLSGTVSDNGTSNTSEFGFSLGDEDVFTDYPPLTPFNFYRVTENLNAGTQYNYYAWASNNEGTGQGESISFATLPNSVTNLTSPSKTTNSIYLNWTKGTGSENTTIRYRTDGTYPVNYTDGTLAYSGTASSANITGLSDNTTHKIKAWAVNTDYEIKYSASGTELTVTTEAQEEEPSEDLMPPTNFEVSNYGAITTLIEWTKGNNSTYTMLRASAYSYPKTITSGELIYYGLAEELETTDFLIDKTYYATGWGFDSDNVTYSATYTIFNIGGDDLIISHLLALIPLLVLLICSLVFYGKGLIHLLTGAYSLTLGYLAIVNTWELLFFPIVVLTVIIAIILFWYSMVRGNWL